LFGRAALQQLEGTPPSGEPDIYSFGAITDDRPMEVVAAGQKQSVEVSRKETFNAVFSLAAPKKQHRLMQLVGRRS
jgi:hypothetical protein